MKKGFTLIELLAVIVILAIIALIATPIILGIINDAREESNKRSVELYASAVKNGIAAHQLRTGNEVAADIYNQKDENKQLPFEVETDGTVVCERIEIYEDGGVYVTDCTVNGDPVNYAYGTKQQFYKPQYYYFGYDWSGTVGTTAAPESPSTVPPTGKNIYLGYDVDNNKVTAAYVCFKREENGTEYCLKGGDEGAAYDTNNTVLEEVFGASACSFGGAGDGSFCSADGLYASAYSLGDVYAGDDAAGCAVYYHGGFGCNEY